MTYQIIYKDMPCTIEAFTTCNLDDNYTIFLNPKLNYERQWKAFIHEIQHILNQDFYKTETVEEIENQYY